MDLAFEREQYARLRGDLAGMASEHISWFNSQHYAQVATGLAAAGHADARFWAAMEATSERRLLSFSGHNLAQLMVALATSGHVPSLNWLQRTEIQASKHWKAMSPGALAGAMWAWGRLNYTPSRSFLEVLKQRLRGMMRRQQLGCQQLLQVLYGVARLTRDHPRDVWLHAWCEEFQPHMAQVSPHVLADALFCLASLQFQPRRMWLAAALSQVRRGVSGRGQGGGRSSINGSSSGSRDDVHSSMNASSSSSRPGWVHEAHTGMENIATAAAQTRDAGSKVLSMGEEGGIAGSVGWAENGHVQGNGAEQGKADSARGSSDASSIGKGQSARSSLDEGATSSNDAGPNSEGARSSSDAGSTSKAQSARSSPDKGARSSTDAGSNSEGTRSSPNAGSNSEAQSARSSTYAGSISEGARSSPDSPDRARSSADLVSVDVQAEGGRPGSGNGSDAALRQHTGASTPVGGAAVRFAQHGDDAQLMGRTLRQPAQGYQSLQDMLGETGSKVEEEEGEEEKEEDDDEGSFLEGIEERNDYVSVSLGGADDAGPAEGGLDEEEESFLEGEEGEDNGKSPFLEESEEEGMAEEEDMFLLGEDELGGSGPWPLSSGAQESYESSSPAPLAAADVRAAAVHRSAWRRSQPPVSPSDAAMGDYLEPEDKGPLTQLQEDVGHHQQQQQQQQHVGDEDVEEWHAAAESWGRGAAASAHNPDFQQPLQDVQQPQQQQQQGQLQHGQPEQGQASGQQPTLQQQGNTKSSGQGAAAQSSGGDLQQPGTHQYTLLVPSLAVSCCPLVGREPFMQEQQQQLQRGSGLDSVRLAQLAWSLNAMDFTPQPAWMDAFSSHALSLLPSMDALALADTLYSLSNQGVNLRPAFLAAVAERLHQLVQPASTAAAAAGVGPASSAAELPDPEALVSTLVALARFEACALPLLPACPPQQLSRMSWALAVLGHKPPTPWLHELLVHIRARMKAMSDSDLACVAWSFARLRHRPGSLWLEDFCEEARRRLPHLPTQQVVDIVWALAAFAHPPNPEWMETLEVLFLSRWHTFKPQHTAVLLWAMQQFKHLPQSSFLQAADATLNKAQPSVISDTTI
ncbi:hypothetical protein DUNSADRAFT_15418 [Dunaliella salina]|nr:hypothetical protein DUNSADRAFT_15418 [Dunaliella salina]|eukprot:KAF5829854.1 hypothetical protein DUNSADRAFT_15418 [Dunaliella salina]